MNLKNHYSLKSNLNFILIVFLFLTFTLLEKAESIKKDPSETIQTFAKYCYNFTEGI